MAGALQRETFSTAKALDWSFNRQAGCMCVLRVLLAHYGHEPETRSKGAMHRVCQ